MAKFLEAVPIKSFKKTTSVQSYKPNPNFVRPVIKIRLCVCGELASTWLFTTKEFLCYDCAVGRYARSRTDIQHPSRESRLPD